VSRVNIVKRIKIGGRWKMFSIPRQAKGNYDWNTVVVKAPALPLPRHSRRNAASAMNWKAGSWGLPVLKRPAKPSCCRSAKLTSTLVGSTRCSQSRNVCEGVTTTADRLIACIAFTRCTAGRGHDQVSLSLQGPVRVVAEAKPFASNRRRRIRFSSWR
jgi:hypothetical protein